MLCGLPGRRDAAAPQFDERTIEVVEVIDRWLAPDHRYFKLRVPDGATYIVRRDVISAAWELVLFDRQPAPVRGSSRHTE
jgi:hypothetical protein